MYDEVEEVDRSQYIVAVDLGTAMFYVSVSVCEIRRRATKLPASQLGAKRKLVNGAQCLKLVQNMELGRDASVVILASFLTLSEKKSVFL